MLYKRCTILCYIYIYKRCTVLSYIILIYGEELYYAIIHNCSKIHICLKMYA